MIRGLGLGLLLLCGLGCRREGSSAPAAIPAASCAGDSVLRISVQPGDYIHAVADQENRAVTLTLLDTPGRQLLYVDNLNVAKLPPYPAAEVHWVADVPGELRIELRIDQTFPPGLHGPCNLRLAEHRRATKVDRERALAELDLARAHALRRTHKPEACRAAIPRYENAQRRFAELGLPRRRAEAFLGLGQLQQEDLHDDPAALKTYTRAEPLFAGDPIFEALVRQHLGKLRYDSGDLDGAIREYQKSLELRERLKDRAGEALICNDLGLALQLRGHYDKAATLFDRALAFWQKGSDPREWATTLINRGQLHQQLGDVDDARAKLSQALDIVHRTGDRDGEATALHALGRLALETKQPGVAVEHLQGALKLRSAGSRGWAATQTSLGVAYRHLGRPDEARRAYEEALPIFRKAGDLGAEARGLDNLARLEASTGHDDDAFVHFDRAVDLFRKLSDPPQMALAQEGKARVLRRRGDLEAAQRLMEEALAAIEQHRFRQTSFTTRAEFFATQQGFYDFLIDLLMEQHQNAKALAVNERSLARSLLDGLAASGTDLHHGGASPALYARERELEHEIDALVSRQTRLGQDAASPAQLKPVETELKRLWDELDRVRSALRAGDPRYAALTEPRPASAAEIQRKLLDRDTLLLEYRLGQERSVLWAVTPESLQSFVLPGRAEIEKLTRQVCGLLATSQSHTAEISAEQQLAKLSRLLLDPVAPLLPGKRLLVVGDGILQSLPFAALSEPGNNEPLLARHEIVNLPSVSVLGVLRREVARRAPAPKTLWVLAHPDFGKVFPALPNTRQEAAAILALTPDSQRFTVQDRQASRAAVLNGDLGSYRFLHFATHGSFAADEPEGGRLVLAQVGPQGRPEPNGFLNLADIYELNLRADLVVLSACQSALGREVRGEGMMGMTRGFFYAGAERVLVSLWNVNDQVTGELMWRFYLGVLVEHLSPAAALRQAQDAIRLQPRWHAPYYWAGFTLHGEWQGRDRR